MGSKAIELTQSGGSAGQVEGFSTDPVSAPVTSNNLVQVVGMIPLISCSYSDCRETQQRGCYYSPVFGNVIDGDPETEPTYENDFNAFLIDVPTALPKGGSLDVILQRLDNTYYTATIDGTWTDVAFINDGSCGIYYPVGSITEHLTYGGYVVNWGKVVNLYGAGIYRICFKYEIINTTVVFTNGIPVPTVNTNVIKCMVSMPFELLAWDCTRAHGTVKFESWNTGALGSIDAYYRLYDLCDISWYDSIRFRGFFGLETTPKYEEIINEYQSGLLEEVRNKLTNNFTLMTYYLPKWVHDRLKSYAWMADTLLVSDYNVNNSDYFIKRKAVRRDSGHEPTYLDGKNFDRVSRYLQRRSKATVKFREGVESVIKTLCCLPKC